MKGYCWWTCGIWRDSIKLGPIAVGWFYYHDRWNLTICLLCRWSWEVSF